MKRKIIGVLAALVLAGIGTTALVAYVESAKDEAVAAEALVDVYVVNETIPKGTSAAEIAQSVKVTQVPAKVPHGWIVRMKRALRTLGWRFNTDRMVMDYARECYLPSAGATSSQMPK